MKLVYFSLTGQTRRFVAKTGLPHLEISQTNPFIDVDEPFILIVPTYEAEITEPVWDFLDYGVNQSFLKGVIGGGNRNFAELFIFTAKDIAKEYDTPILYEFEFNGTDEDVKYVQKVVKDFESE